MAFCPKCKEKVEFLKQVTTGIEKCHIFFNEKEGWIDWSDEEFESDGVVRLFSCPKCNNELDFNDEEAIKFLKEKDELQEIVVEKLKKIENDKINKN